MLAQLRIRNLAIIESVALPLAPGLNVLSGETGAGKSIIVGALGLLIGERASSDDVRTGADKATVEGEFSDVTSPDALQALDGHGIDVDGGVVVLKREVATTGRTRAWVNGTPVSAGVLATVGRLLVNIHGQHDAQALLDEPSQRAMLDRYAGAAAAADQVAALHAAAAKARAALAERIARRDDVLRRADFLRHVADEVEAAKLTEGEEDALASESARLTHAEELTALTAEIGAALDETDDSISPRLGHLQRALSALQRIDPATERLQALFDAAFYAVDELAREIAAYAGTVEHDPARLADVERRRDVIYRLVAKHGGSVAKAIAAGASARAELDAIDTAAHDVAALEAAVGAADSALKRAAVALTALRKAGATRFAAAVEKALPALGMEGGRFSVALLPRSEIAPSGAEDVEYRVALNVGHDDRPLARVASGGELSRVMLAMKTILAGVDQVPTLIFDEVDSGIGGAVGLMVGDAMRSVSDRHQVFAITHLAQIASRADHHVVVRKGARGGVTSADIAIASGDGRIEELARMLGGDPSSDASRAHARELLSAAAPRSARTAANTTGRSRRRA